MHATDFLKSPVETIPAVVALVGDERGLKTSVIEALLRDVLSGEDDSPTRLNGQDAELKSVRDELRTISMWSDRRVVIVDDAADFVTANRSGLEQYCENPARKSLLVLDVKSMPKNTRLYKIISKSGLIVECSELKGAALMRWVQETAEQRYEKRIDLQAMQLLIQLVGNQVGLLDQELSKLTSYVGEHPRIEVEAVQRLAGGWKAETTWAMTDAIRDGRLSEALMCLDKLLNAGESPYRILGGMTVVFRKFAEATELSRQGVPLKAALKKAGVFPRDVDAGDRYLRRIGRAVAERIGDFLLEVDTSMKGGSRLPERILLERLLVRLSGSA